MERYSDHYSRENNASTASPDIVECRPFVIEAARVASLNQTQQDIWEQSWIGGVSHGYDIVTNPTCPQPGFSLTIRQFVTLNHL